MHLSNPKITRVSAKDIAYTEIKERIIKCSFQPGEPIVEDELANELEISRTPLREALQRLEIEELVERQPNGRLKVASISVQEVKELFLVRSLLEGIIVVEAIDNITENDIKHMSYLVYMIKENSRESNYEDVNHFGSQFHSALYNLSHNRTVIKILYQLNDKISRYRRLAHYVDTRKTSDEHEIILDHIVQKDRHNAEITIKNHILDSMNQAVEAVKRYEDSLQN
ncbi:GntR family transcriptional regulator [Fredinandcohnia salidurans]|uniref:GntR family transcriptional regulator n=1 Tax=Fredinandcohnia salidurans TaxID=2595041 RepID=A0ABW4MMW3_9BACI|nr:GntR family transcriptional regulator [Fredinandcohnia onubensis]